MAFEGLKVIDASILKDFEKFIKNLKKSDKLAIIMDHDSDGLSSAALVGKAIPKVSKASVYKFENFDKDPKVFLEKMARLKNEGVNKIITVDLPMEQYHGERLGEWVEWCEIMVIDHHKVESYPSSPRLLMIKPQRIFDDVTPSSYPTAKFSYDLFSQFADLSEFAWLSCIGIVGDASYLRWKTFVDEQTQKKGLKNNSDIYQSDFGKLSLLIYCVDSVEPQRMIELLDYFSTHQPKEILSSGFNRDVEIIEKEISEKLKEFDEKKEEFPKQELIFFSFACKYPIQSILINQLSFKRYPTHSLVFVSDSGKPVFSISARRQDMKVKMNDLLHEVTVPLGGKGGGHIPAAGGMIPKNKLVEFKKALVDALSTKKFQNNG